MRARVSRPLSNSAARSGDSSTRSGARVVDQFFHAGGKSGRIPIDPLDPLAQHVGFISFVPNFTNAFDDGNGLCRGRIGSNAELAKAGFANLLSIGKTAP